MEFLNIYFDLESCRLRVVLVEDIGIGVEYILVGCGVDEFIDFIMW